MTDRAKEADAGRGYARILNSRLTRLALLLVVAVGVRLCFLGRAGVIETDGVLYTRMARSLQAGEGFLGLNGKPSLSARPLYPWLVAAVQHGIGDWELSGRVASLSVGALVPLLVCLLGISLFGEGAGFLAGLLTAVSPELASCSIQVMTESTYSFAVCLALVVFITARRRSSPGAFFVSGAVWALPYLTRPEGVLFWGANAVAILLLPPRAAPLKRRVVDLVWHALGVAAIVLPYTAWFHSIRGEWTLSPEIGVVTPGSFPDALRTAYYDVYLRHLPRVFPLLLSFLAGLGFLRSILVDRKIRENAFLLLYVVAFLCVYPWRPWWNTSARHYIPALPLLYVWVGHGLLEPARWLPYATRGQVALKRVLTPLLVGLVIASFLPRLLPPIGRHDAWQSQARECRIVGEWIRSHGGPGKRIMTRSPEVAFYADAFFLRIPTGTASWPELMNHARAGQVDYIVVDRRWTCRGMPWLARILDAGQAPEGATSVFRWQERPGFEVEVFIPSAPAP